MSRFLANVNDTSNHLTVLKQNLELYDEAYFAVAFFKDSGFKLLSLSIQDFLSKGGQIHIVVGQNFALTEPKALHNIRDLFKYYPESKLYLDKAITSNVIFHPKLYLFKSNTDCTIISGSANITQSGLISNKETSIQVDCKSEDQLWLDAKQYFNKLISSENADEASLFIIKKYETFFEQQKQYNKKAKAIPLKNEAQLAFDYKNLLKYYKEFNNEERQQEFRDKVENYEKAKIALDQIADDPGLSQEKFESILDILVGSKEEYNLWHSGSLFRLRRKVYPFYKEFRDLVIYIRQNKDRPASIVFENAKIKVKDIEGASVNYITEIMMTYNNIEFANMNKNPITVLREEAGINMKAHSSSFTGLDYQEYCELVKEISAKLGLDSMLEADSFFNTIYWDWKKKSV